MGLFSHGPRYNSPNWVEQNNEYMGVQPTWVEQNNTIWRDNMSDEIGTLLDFYCVVEKAIADMHSSKNMVMSVLKKSLLTTLKRTEQARVWGPDMRDNTLMLFELCATIENTIKGKDSWNRNEVLEVLKTSLIKTLKHEVARNQQVDEI